MRRWHRRSRPSWVAAVALLAGLLPTSVVAAAPAHPAPGAIGPAVTVSAGLHDPCFSIANAVGTDPLVVIHRRDGVRVGKVSVPISDVMRPCTGTLRPRDTIEIRQSGARLRLLVIPTLALRVDLVGHRLVGRVPADGSAVAGITHRVAGLTTHREDGPVSPDSEGRFHLDASSPGNLWPGDIGSLSWTSPRFDRWTLYASTPSVTVRTWSSDVTVTGGRGRRVVVTVEDDGTVRGRYARQLPPYEVLTFGTLKRSGTPIRARKGDVVRHGAIDGRALTVLPNTMTVKRGGGGELTTTCFPNGGVVVDVNDNHRAESSVNASGVVNLIDINGGEDLEPGDEILLGCQNRKGGAQLKRYVVP